MSSLSSGFIIIGTLGSLLAFFLILYLNRSTRNPGKTTGHNYDGIEEYDNPLPAWWFWGFISPSCSASAICCTTQGSAISPASVAGLKQVRWRPRRRRPTSATARWLPSIWMFRSTNW